MALPLFCPKCLPAADGDPRACRVLIPLVAAAKACIDAAAMIADEETRKREVDKARRECGRVLAPVIQRWQRCLFLLAKKTCRGRALVAEAAVQETIVRVFKGGRTFAANACAAPWIQTVCSNEAHRAIQAWTRDARRAEKLRIFPRPQPAPPVQPDAAAALKECLDRLFPDERKAVILKYVARMNYVEIARELGYGREKATELVNAGERKLLDCLGHRPHKKGGLA